ncbi:alpha/beta fold hydrolase [Shigella flexneri]
MAAFGSRRFSPSWRNAISWHFDGGAISTLFLQRHPGARDAIALTAPTFGIVIRTPSFMARADLNWAEAHPRFRDGYATGTGRWRALPFAINVLTHSRQRYRRNLRFYADDPTFASVGRPTIGYAKHSGWRAGVSRCGDDATPTLLLQAKRNAWWITGRMTVL